MVFSWHGTMARYVTLRRVTVSWDAAVRFALREGLPLEKIRCAPDAELLHRTDWWAWWSDERLTGAIGIPEELRPVSLTADAEQLIDEFWWGSPTIPACGWRLLAQVKLVLDRQISPCYKSSQTAFWERLRVLLLDGQICVLYWRWAKDLEECWSCRIVVEPSGVSFSTSSE
jgi:hypothetical protein